jgi:hypothetical protein
MSTITTRAGKGSPLTNTELDANFTNLNADKYESGSDAALNTVSVLVLLGQRAIKQNIQIPDGFNAVLIGPVEIDPNVTITGLGNSTLKGV